MQKSHRTQSKKKQRTAVARVNGRSADKTTDTSHMHSNWHGSKLPVFSTFRVSELPITDCGPVVKYELQKMWKEAAVAKYHVSPNISALFSREASFSGIGVHIGIQTSHLRNRDQKL